MARLFVPAGLIPPGEAGSSYPCYDPVGAVRYTQPIPAMAEQIDDSLRSSPA